MHLHSCLREVHTAVLPPHLVMVISLQAFHTCAVCSQSHRHDRTYSPGAVSAGMRTVSTMLTVVGQLPAQRPGLVPYLPRAMGARTAGLVPLLHGGGKSAL